VFAAEADAMVNLGRKVSGYTPLAPGKLVELTSEGQRLKRSQPPRGSLREFPESAPTASRHGFHGVRFGLVVPLEAE
jgi:hypothetical protein